jgi:SnoaL-like domain
MVMTALDYEGIRQLLARYCLALDFGDTAAVQACFAPDGYFEAVGLPPESPNGGKHRDLAEFAAELFAATQGHTRHWASSTPLIEGDGESAAGTLYLTVFRPGEAPDAGIVVTGVYRDRYVKIGGRWLFAARQFTADPQPEHRDRAASDVLVVRWDAFVSSRN